MYKASLQKLNEKLCEIEQEKIFLEKRRQNIQYAYLTMMKLQAEYLTENNLLAVQRGICPFPESCNRVKECDLRACEADTCSNGFAYRMS